MVGKIAITVSYGTVYIFSAEQFPTVVRNAGLGASSTFARLGSIMAPYINIMVINYTFLVTFLWKCVLITGAYMATVSFASFWRFGLYRGCFISNVAWNVKQKTTRNHWGRWEFWKVSNNVTSCGKMCKMFSCRKSKRHVTLNSVKVMETNETEENPDAESNLLKKRPNPQS